MCVVFLNVLFDQIGVRHVGRGVCARASSASFLVFVHPTEQPMAQDERKGTDAAPLPWYAGDSELRGFRKAKVFVLRASKSLVFFFICFGEVRAVRVAPQRLVGTGDEGAHSCPVSFGFSHANARRVVWCPHTPPQLAQLACTSLERGSSGPPNQTHEALTLPPSIYLLSNFSQARTRFVAQEPSLRGKSSWGSLPCLSGGLN